MLCLVSVASRRGSHQLPDELPYVCSNVYMLGQCQAVITAISLVQ